MLSISFITASYAGDAWKICIFWNVPAILIVIYIFVRLWSCDWLSQFGILFCLMLITPVFDYRQSVHWRICSPLASNAFEKSIYHFLPITRKLSCCIYPMIFTTIIVTHWNDADAECKIRFPWNSSGKSTILKYFWKEFPLIITNYCNNWVWYLTKCLYLAIPTRLAAVITDYAHTTHNEDYSRYFVLLLRSTSSDPC